MKKLALTIAIVLGLAVSGFAQFYANNNNYEGGLFQRGAVSDETYYGYGGFAYDRASGLFTIPGLPYHNFDSNQDAPLGSGIAVLLGLGGAYLVAKRRKED